MKWVAGLVSLSLIGFSAHAQTPVPILREPFHHLRLDNSLVRIFDVKVPPWKTTLYHIHAEDYVFVTFGDSILKSQILGQNEEDLILKSGEVRFKSGPITHRVRNEGGKTFHNLTIELLRPFSGKASSSPDTPLGKHQTIALENDRIRVVRTVLRMGQSTGFYTHRGPGVAVVVKGGTLLTRTEGRGMEARSLRSGTFTWRESASSHSISNTGRREIELIDIEIK
jgi:quercetin dioxygenase-like cupin family protein